MLTGKSHHSHRGWMKTGGCGRMNKCHICGEPIWEDRWPVQSNGTMKRNVCFFCFSRIKEGGSYRPRIYNRSNLAVCDKCGEISSNVKLTGAGWFCEECVE
jgi:formylmethanofuran dehydrogenase subunit E